MLGLLAFTGMSAAVVTGHLSFFLMLVITLAWRDARAGRWSHAGAWLGLGMSVKPFLLIFVPYLALKRRWRALAAMGLAVGTAFMVGLLVFGPTNHRSWLRVLSLAESWAWLPMNASLFGFMSRIMTKNPGYRLDHRSGARPAPVDLAGAGDPRGRAFAVAGLHRFLETRAATGRSAFSWSVRSYSLPWAGLTTSGCPSARSRRWLEVGGFSDRCRLAMVISASCWLSWYLLLASLSGLVFPVWLSLTGQPSALATLLFGGMSFGSLVLVWLSLLVDGLDPCWMAARARPFVLSARNVGVRVSPFFSEWCRTMMPQLEPLARDDFRISVVMPVFSETESVRTIANWLRTHLGSRLLEVIIVISPRSSQASHDVCQELARNDPTIRVFEQEENPGVGRAFREGYARVRGNLVLSMDSDGEMELATIPRMIDAMAERNVGLVVGSRWLPGGGFVGYAPVKRWFNWGFQQVFRILFRTRIHDLTYGFKLLRAELVHEIPWEGTLHEIGCETTLKPIRLGIPSRRGANHLGGSKGGPIHQQLPAQFPICRHGLVNPRSGCRPRRREPHHGRFVRVLSANEGSVT